MYSNGMIKLTRYKKKHATNVFRRIRLAYKIGLKRVKKDFKDTRQMVHFRIF